MDPVRFDQTVIVNPSLDGRDNVDVTCERPFLVHCLAGIGRTGTFIVALSLSLCELDGENLDIVGIINQMRKCRPRMVPDVAQFEFLQRFLDNKDNLY